MIETIDVSALNRQQTSRKRRDGNDSTQKLQLEIYLELLYSYECLFDQCEKAENTTSDVNNFDLDVMKNQLIAAKESSSKMISDEMGIIEPKIELPDISILTGLDATIKLRQALVELKWKATDATEIVIKGVSPAVQVPDRDIVPV